MKYLPVFLLPLVLISCNKPEIVASPQIKAHTMLPVFEKLLVIDNGKYNAFGIAVSLKDGSSAIIYREGTSHVGDIGMIKMRMLKDWKKAITIYSDSLDDRNIAGGVTATGRIVVFFGRYKNTWRDLGYIYSDDGITWTTYQTISTGNNTAYSAYGPLVTLPDGTLMQSWYGIAGNVYSSYVIKSNDNGLSWGPAVAALTSSTVQYTETSFMAVDNKIIGLARAENTPFYTEAVSSDNGASWNSRSITTDTVGSIKSPPFLFNGHCLYTNRNVNKIRLMDYVNGEWLNRRDLTSLDAGGYPSVDKNGIGWFWNQINPGNAQIVLFKLRL